MKYSHNLIVEKVIFHGKENHGRWFENAENKCELPVRISYAENKSILENSCKVLRKLHDRQEKLWLKFFDFQTEQ
ncbi:hypothetical protein [Acinetobacter larvae]|uniref:Uncharacterized protein n=1 Tax=Acinetobacter larvae TaxID=1789224 RepID=A0A1B2M307_9GAMM|nr:hypothetical protein [Acinetobacter larvae]AOA59577.1 hypothetical protein BFG52_15310 [Acinetobacter larvae]